MANWSWVDLGNNPNIPKVDGITRKQLQWNIFNDNNTDNRSGQRHKDHDSRTSEDTESIEGDPIYLITLLVCSKRSGNVSV